jgi:AcrR family transcriptional regulator
MNDEPLPTTGLRARNKLDKRARIQLAARRLFIAQGFAETTIEQIAKAADVAKGTVFLYAKDKRDLLISVLIDTIRTTSNDRFASLPDGPALDQVVHVFSGFLAEYANYPQLSRLFIKEALFLDGERHTDYQALNTDFFIQLAGLLQEAQARGELSHDLDLMAACRNLFGLYAIVLVEWLEDLAPQLEMGVAMLRQSLAMLFWGMAPR